MHGFCCAKWLDVINAATIFEVDHHVTVLQGMEVVSDRDDREPSKFLRNFNAEKRILLKDREDEYSNMKFKQVWTFATFIKARVIIKIKSSKIALKWQPEKKHLILLMAEILHHPTCMKPYKQWDFNYLSLNWWVDPGFQGPINKYGKNPSASSGIDSQIYTRGWNRLRMITSQAGDCLQHMPLSCLAEILDSLHLWDTLPETNRNIAPENGWQRNTILSFWASC